MIIISFDFLDVAEALISIFLIIYSFDALPYVNIIMSFDWCLHFSADISIFIFFRRCVRRRPSAADYFFFGGCVVSFFVFDDVAVNISAFIIDFLLHFFFDYLTQIVVRRL